MKDRNFLFGKKSMKNYQGLQRQDGRGNKTNLGNSKIGILPKALRSLVNKLTNILGVRNISQRSRCRRIFSMMSRSSIKLMISIDPWHFGQSKGSTSYTFWIRRAQFCRNSNDFTFDEELFSVICRTWNCLKNLLLALEHKSSELNSVYLWYLCQESNPANHRAFLSPVLAFKIWCDYHILYE